MERVNNNDEFIRGVNAGKTEFRTNSPKLKLELSAVESLQKVLPYISKERHIANRELDLIEKAEKHDFIIKMAILVLGFTTLMVIIHLLKDKKLFIKTKGKLFGEMEISLIPAEPAPQKPIYKDVGNGIRLEYPNENPVLILP